MGFFLVESSANKACFYNTIFSMIMSCKIFDGLKFGFK